LGESICAPGPDTKTERREKQASVGAKKQIGPRREGPSDLSRGDREKERPLKRRDNLQCPYLNARSLIGKFDLFETWVCNINPDVIAVTETWTNKNILDSEIALPGYSLFRRDEPVDREGGGVLLC